MTDSPEPPAPDPIRVERFPLRPPSRVSGGRLGLVALVIVVLAQVSMSTNEIWPLVLGAILVGVLLPLAAYLSSRRPTTAAAIELLPDRLHLPISSGTGTVPIRFRDVTSLFLRDDPTGFLTVGTSLGSFVFPIKGFVDPSHPRRLAQAIREQLLALPDGELRLKAIDEKGAQAERTFAHPLRATILILIMLVIVFVLERLGGAFARPFSLVSFGAAARYLVLDGQWYRIFTASLLHANELHIFVNGLAIYSLGGAIERLYGSRNFILVYAMGAVMGALLSVISDRAEMSVGASTAAFGLLGAFAFTSYRYRDRMPTGFQPPLRWWIWVLGLNLGLSLFVRVIDFPAHLGGFLGGVIVSAFLVDGEQELPLRGRTPLWASIATALLVVVHLVAVGFAVERYVTGGHEDEDRLIANHIERDRAESDGLNEIAWTIAIDPQATRLQLELAKKASLRSLEKLEIERREQELVVNDSDAIGKMFDLQRWMTSDTVATVDYRLGEFDDAIRREVEVVRTRNEPGIATQLARFMRARVQKAGPLVEPALTVTSSLGVTLGYESSRGFFVNIAPTAPIPEAITAFGLVTAGGSLVGMLEMRLEPQGIEPRRIWLEQQNIFAAWPNDATMTVAYLTPSPLKGWHGWSADKTYLSYP